MNVKKIKTKWYTSLNSQTLIGLGIFAFGLISSLILAINTEGKKLIFKESSRLIQQTGNNAVSDLYVRSQEIAGLTRSLGIATERLPKSQVTFSEFMPELIDFQGDLGIAGGGVWPEPYQFDPKAEKSSLFWGREVNGKLRFYDDYNLSKTGYHNEEWYVIAQYLKPGRCFWSGSYVDPFSQEPMVTCTVATENAGNFSGAVTIDLRLEGLQAFTESWREKTGGYVFIVDRDNKFISFPDLDLVKRTKKDSQGQTTTSFITASELAKNKPLFAPIAQTLTRLNQEILEQARQMPDYRGEIATNLEQSSYQIDAQKAELMNVILTDPLAEKTGSTRLLTQFQLEDDWLLEEKAITYVFHVPDTYWKLVVVKPVSESVAVANSIAQFLINRAAIIVAIGALLALLAVRFRLLKPIKNLSAAAHKIASNPNQLAENNWQQKLQTNRPDEIGGLARAFSNMGLQLQDSFATLEDRVKERTAELASANQEITVLNEKLKAENLRMGAELNVARQLQQMVLPKPEELENLDGIDVVGFMEPADEVGGDYYDVLHTDGVVTIGIGDVTGHGLESGILMLMTQTAVRTLQEIKESDPIRFLDTLNRTIYRNIQRMDSEKNLTLAIINYSQGRVSVSGQHEETIVVRAGGHVELIDTIDLGLPIGIDDDIADFIDHRMVELNPGDGVVFYTDGIPEAFDMEKKQYGMERLCDVISKNWQLTAEEIKQAVIDDVRQFIGKQKVFDDITLLVLKQK